MRIPTAVRTPLIVLVATVNLLLSGCTSDPESDAERPNIAFVVDVTGAMYPDTEGYSIFEEPSREGGHLCRCLEKNLSPNRADARDRFCEGEKNLFIFSSLTV